MAYYLQTDGVDDCVYYSAINIAPNFMMDEIILDCMVTATPGAFDKYVSSASSGFLQRNGSGQDHWSGSWTSATVDGVPGTNLTAFVPVGKRITIRILGTPTLNSQVYAFANNTAGGGSMPGRLYGFTVKSAGAEILRYDFTLGHAQDQSGNGRNGTVVGATWVSDGPTGTAGTVSYSTKQIISRAASTAHSTKQIISQAGQTTAATKQVIYRAASDLYPMRQSVYSTGANLFPLQQVITQGGIPGSALYSTTQRIYSVGTASNAMQQKIYRTGSTLVATRQSVYAPGAVLPATKQVIYSRGSLTAATRQIVYRYASQAVPVVAMLYRTGSIDYPLRIAIYDEDMTIIGTVRLIATVERQVYLMGIREIDVHLRGDVD